MSGEEGPAIVAPSIMERGRKALAPSGSTLWARRGSRSFGTSSNWSERHAVYVSVPVTFGLCGGPIKPAGKALRLGSVVACMQAPPASKPYNDRHEYCLFHSCGTCGKCTERFQIGTRSCGPCQTGATPPADPEYPLNKQNFRQPLYFQHICR